MNPFADVPRSFFCRFFIVPALLLLNHSYSFAQNEAAGEKLFELNCASCHTFKQDGIGPQLGGLNEVVDKKYLTEFIKNPKAMIDARVARASDKYRKFKTVMPGFAHLKASELDDVVAFILDQTGPGPE